jgi:nucleoside-diphosphate-sugar epimerase
MSLNDFAQVAISGASGWLGKETISLISQGKIPGYSTNELLLFSSNGKTIELTDNLKFASSNFLSDKVVSEKIKLDGFIHLAFLTRDKLKNMSESEYVRVNLNLISRACMLVENCRPSWIVLVSSGAVLDRQSGQLETDIHRNPYGFCKRVEELLLADVAKKVGASIVIGRLWGATGAQMPPNMDYAISNFIESARVKGRIHINSGGDVFRRYIDAAEFMEVLVRLAISGDSRVLDSGGELLELADLGDLVASFFPQTTLSRSTDIGPTDDYFPKCDEFNEIAGNLGVMLSNIKEQVNRTVNGHVLKSMK